MSEMSDAGAAREHFRATVAPDLLRKVGFLVQGEMAPVPGGDHSKRLAFYTDGRRAGIALRAGEDMTHSVALAHAVHHSDGRPLVLVLPEKAPHGSAAQCIPWLSQEIALWEYGKDVVPKQVKTTRKDALGRIPDEVVYAAHDLGDRTPWVTTLLDWVSSHPELEDASRQSVKAWHVEGRSVLRINRTECGLWLSAGVNYSKPRPGKTSPFATELKGPLSPDDYAFVTSLIEKAIKDRLDGTDDENEEHRFQAWLTRNFGEVGLATRPWREFPSHRNGSRSYIDLLGVDAANRLRVIETKLGDADDLILQGLEYWIWTRRCADALADKVGFDLKKTPCIDYVILRDELSRSPLRAYSRSLLGRLPEDIAWRFHLATRKGRNSYHVTSYPEGVIP